MRRVAIQRAPLVYAVEAIDNGGHALDLVIPRDAALRARFRADLLNGVEVIRGDGSSSVCRRSLLCMEHRGQGEMAVWIKEKP